MVCEVFPIRKNLIRKKLTDPFPAKELDNILRINRRKREKQKKVGEGHMRWWSVFPGQTKAGCFAWGRALMATALTYWWGQPPHPCTPTPLLICPPPLNTGYTCSSGVRNSFGNFGMVITVAVIVRAIQQIFMNYSCWQWPWQWPWVGSVWNNLGAFWSKGHSQDLWIHSSVTSSDRFLNICPNSPHFSEHLLMPSPVLKICLFLRCDGRRPQTLQRKVYTLPDLLNWAKWLNMVTGSSFCYVFSTLHFTPCSAWSTGQDG